MRSATRGRARGRRAVSAVVLVLLGFGAALGASGCTAPGKTPPATPSPTAASTVPVLPTNEEALAIVEELVPKFLAAEAAVMTGSAELASLELLATAEHMESIRTSVEQMTAAGRAAVGVASATNFSIQSVGSIDGSVEIRAYGCYDVSGFDIVDSSGLSVRAPDIPSRFSVVFEFISSVEGFKSNGSEPWSGANSC